jgi:hypothetical protein
MMICGSICALISLFYLLNQENFHLVLFNVKKDTEAAHSQPIHILVIGEWFYVTPSISRWKIFNSGNNGFLDFGWNFS